MNSLSPLPFARLAAGMMLTVLAGCAVLPSPEHEAPSSAPDVTAESTRHRAGDPSGFSRQAGWEDLQFPGKSPTHFNFERKEGRDALAAVAQSSASMKRRKLDVPPQALGDVRFSWLVPDLIQQADMGRRDLDDSPVRIVLVFDGDRSRFSAADALLSELARAVTGEELPYATLMYVWCNQRPAGTVIQSPRTSRIRKLVVESGAANLGRWMDYERDIRADFERVFGEPPGALRGVAIMTDTDNTRTLARAWYGPVKLSSDLLTRP